LHPKIQDVQVIGIPDARDGEELCAWVCLRDGGRDPCSLRGSDRALQDPALCQIRRRLPMAVAGKIQKFLMRQQMIDELGLSLQATA
jgi:fatty-acyl-CoA synthase